MVDNKGENGNGMGSDVSLGNSKTIVVRDTICGPFRLCTCGPLCFERERGRRGAGGIDCVGGLFPISIWVSRIVWWQQSICTTSIIGSESNGEQ